MITRELRDLCDQVSQFAGEIRKDLQHAVANTAAKLVALFMFAKAYKSYQAALLLYQEGFWQDAATIARTLLELSLQAKWLDRNAETAGKLFLRGADRERIKLVKNLQLNGDEQTQIHADTILRELVSSSDIDVSWYNWWGNNSNIKKLATDVGYEQVYGLQYQQLCWFVHSSPITIRYYLDQDECAEGISADCVASTPPRRYQELAETFFSSAVAALMDVLAVVDNVFALNRQKHFDRIRLAFHKFNQCNPNLEKLNESNG